MQYVADMRQLCEILLKPGGFAHVIRSRIDFSLFIEALRNWRRVDSAASNEMSAKRIEEGVFEYEKKTFLYLRDPFNDFQPLQKTVPDVNISEQVVQFRQLRLDKDDRLHTLDYYILPA